MHTPIPSPLLEDANLHSGYTNKTVSEDGGAPLGLKSEMSTEVVLGSPEVRSQALSILRGDPPASLTPASCLSKFWFLLWFEMCEGENDSLQTRRGT